MKTFTCDNLAVSIYPDRGMLGRDAACLAAQTIARLLEDRESVNIIFAAAPSQNEFLAAFAAREDIPFSRINAFHMDEYVGLPGDAPQGFANFLRGRLFDKVPFRSVNLLNGQAADLNAECRRYAALLDAYPADIVCMGLGENAHIAFNDPGLADFDDPEAVKIIELAEKSRIQQVNDGCFARLDDVPKLAITLTIPSLTRAAWHFCMVPAATKAQAVYDTLNLPVNADCPGTVLRRMPHARLFLDGDSAALLPQAKEGASC